MFKFIILNIVILYAFAGPIEFEEDFEDLKVESVDFESEPKFDFEIDIDEVFLDKTKRSANAGEQKSTTERTFCRGRNGWC